MKTNWPIVELDTLTERDRSITYGVVKPGEEVEDGVAFVRGGDILAGKLAVGSLRTISPSLSQVYKRTILRGGELLISLVGNPGEVAIAPTELVGANIARQVGLVALGASVSSRFVMYFLMSPNGRAELFTRTGGAVQQVINLADLKTVKIPVPPIQAQERIADILTAYDDLMENNRRRMALLEESARQLYREWFVRRGTERMKDEVGRMKTDLPPGWERVELNSIINVTHGYAFQGADFSDDPTSRVLTTPGNFRIGGGIKIDKLKFYSEAGPLPSDYILAPMDLIVTMTDLSKDSDTLGYPAFVPKLPDMMFLHNQRVGRVMPRGDFFPKHFLYFALCDERYRHHVVGAATGGVIKHTAPKRILSYKLDLPLNRKLIEHFESFTAPLFAQINILVESNEKLRTARDLLLPRLMSGEIEV